MPIYEYKCTNCDYSIELMQELGEDSPPESCPDCEGCFTFEKVISSGSFILKGDGFYKPSVSSE